jgi:hypothetical protein
MIHDDSAVQEIGDGMPGNDRRELEKDNSRDAKLTNDGRKIRHH